MHVILHVGEGGGSFIPESVLSLNAYYSQVPRVGLTGINQ